MDMPSQTPVFLRCKNDGDDGPPISVEWAYASPSHAEIVSAIHLIKPPPEWRSQIEDSEFATNLRGVALAELLQHGEEPVWIAERMNLVLGGRELFSHAPQDGDLLRQLFDAADVQLEFELHTISAETLIADLARLKRLPKAAFARLKRKVQLRTPIYWPSTLLTQMDALLWAEVAEPA